MSPLEEVRIVKDQGFDALVQKDLHGYLDIFSDDVQYTRLNGKTIDKFELYKSTKEYINRIYSIASDYHVEDYFSKGEVYSEVVNQQSSILIRGFLFFLFEWKLTRKAQYWWSKVDGKWKIYAVTVLSEKRVGGSKIRLYSRSGRLIRHGND